MGVFWNRLNNVFNECKYWGMPVKNSKTTLNAEDTFDMAMSLEEADAILAAAGFEDAEATLELV